MNSKKHICLIYEFLSEQGGLEREIINHANMLKSEGYKVTILTCHLNKSILKDLPFENLNVIDIGPKTGIESLDLILSFLGINSLKKFNPDGFLSYSFPMNYLIRDKKTKKINYINHYPHFIYLSKKEIREWSKTKGMKRKLSVILGLVLGRWLRNSDKTLIKKNDLNFVNSEFTKKNLKKIYNMDFIVSYPPVDPQFKPIRLKTKEKYIFSSSRIIPDKRYDLLIQSVTYMKNKLPIYIAGSVDEKYKKELNKIAINNNVKIKFLGKLNTSEIIKYYSLAEIFAFPTPGEDFGLVPAESMSCGTPVVIWGDGAGPTEQIIDGITGYYAEPLNVKDFGEKMDKMIENNIKKKNSKEILSRAKKFSYNEVKKEFVKEIKKII